MPQIAASTPSNSPHTASDSHEAPTAGALGDRVSRRLQTNLGARRYEAYFERHTRLSADQSGLCVAVPSAFHADWLDRRFGSSVRAALAEEAGARARLLWRVDPDAFTPVSEGATEAPTLQPAPAPASAPVRTPKTLRAARPTRPRHTLDDFIVGPSSRLAFGAATQLAESPEPPFGALFLYGPCGVGKTHLLQGVASRFQELRPGSRVRCVSGEAFANQFIASVQAGSIERFRDRYRGVDLLCIDDIHFLRGKVKTQSEFLHTFEALDIDGARVVLASDEHPKRIEELHEGIVSRCMAGMVVGLEQPDHATRTEILRVLMKRRSLVALDDAVEAIAERVPGSVRELEGAVKRVEAYARLMPTACSGPERITPALVERALGGVRPTRRDTPVRLAEIVDAVCSVVGVTHDDILGTSRHQRIVVARGLVVHVARAVTSHSYPEIARAIGRSNHSTAITACQRTEKQIATGHACAAGPGGASSTVAALFDRVRSRVLSAGC